MKGQAMPSNKLIELRADNAIFISYFLRAIGLKILGDMNVKADVEMLCDTADYIDQMIRERLTEGEYQQLKIELKARIECSSNVM